MSKPNERVLRLAWILERLMSSEVTAALESISERLSRADGYPTQAIGASPPLGVPHAKIEGPCLVDSCDHRRPCSDHDGATLTVVERAAEVRYLQGTHREEIRDRLDGLEITVSSFRRYLRTVLGAPAAEDINIPAVPMCRDNQVGKHAVAEWGDASCPKPADKGGLCLQHYLAWWRTKKRDGLNVAHDHEPAAMT